MTYYTDLTAGKVEAGAHLTGSMEFYTIKTSIPLDTKVFNSFEPSAGDNFRVLCDVLSFKGEPVIQGFKEEDGKFIYKFSLEQPCAWGDDEAAVKANIAAKLDGVKVPYVAEGGDDAFDCGEEGNTEIEYSKEL
jgi:hypothetical protein